MGFSFSFPATVMALDGFGAWTATGVRGLLAATLAGGALLLVPGPRPERSDWPALGTVALGCAIGFALLTTLALETTSTAHSAVVIGLLPMATAVIAAVRTGRRPSPAFWLAAGLGATVVVGFTLSQSNGRMSIGDLYLIGAVLVCAAGYAEGGRLARHLPGWRVIAWGLLLAAPINAGLTAIALAHEPVHLTATAVLGLSYVAAISQFGGFIVWYRGMSLIGVERASQLQLAQPLLTLAWAVLLLGETLPPAVPFAAVAVLACIALTQRTAVRPPAGVGRQS